MPKLRPRPRRAAPGGAAFHRSLKPAAVKKARTPRKAIRPAGVHLDAEGRKALRAALAEERTISAAARQAGVNRATAAAEHRQMLKEAVASAREKEEAEDPVLTRRLRDEVRQLRAGAARLERRAAASEEWRASILDLAREPLRPQLDPVPQRSAEGGERIVLLHLTDVHYGESVDAAEMDGVNAYSAAIARKRLARFFDKSAELSTEHWTGPPPRKIVLCLGGDLLSGNIHAELAETNLPAVPATVREMGEIIAGGLQLLRRRVKCPIDVYSVPGNHSRLTLKPQSKGRAAMNLDLLVADFAEAALRGARISGVTFHATASPDAYFSTFAFNWLLNHGDTMGSKGGQGYIGPAATIVRGHRKLIDTAWRSGRAVHYVLTGHLHTTLRTSFGWSGGSVVGYSQYARDLRADPEGARQNMLVIHERHGVINHLELHLGAPGEGSHYAGPATVMRHFAGEEA